MSRDKQIEEMKNCLCDVLDFDYDDERGVTKVDAKTTAEGLYNAGYRKASDVAEEIFAEIEKEFSDLSVTRLRIFPYGSLDKILGTIAELKKKYTEREKDNEKY